MATQKAREASMAIAIDDRALNGAIRDARRELALTETEFARALPRALTSSARRARTTVAGARGILHQRGLNVARVRRRVVSVGAKRGATTPTARVWLGANQIPAEYFRGNFVGRRKPPTRGLTTRRDGAIPRSFSIFVRGKPLYLRRVSRDRYIRILSSPLEDMELAREQAASELPKVLRDEIGKAAFAIRRARARRSS